MGPRVPIITVGAMTKVFWGPCGPHISVWGLSRGKLSCQWLYLVLVFDWHGAQKLHPLKSEILNSPLFAFDAVGGLIPRANPVRAFEESVQDVTRDPESNWKGTAPTCGKFISTKTLKCCCTFRVMWRHDVCTIVPSWGLVSHSGNPSSHRKGDSADALHLQLSR